MDTTFEPAAIMGGLYGDGIIACKGAFSRAWVAQLREDIDKLFEEARARPGGALERGPVPLLRRGAPGAPARLSRHR